MASNDRLARSTPPATHVLVTEKGDRELCLMHAERGHWHARKRRVSAVAS